LKKSELYTAARQWNNTVIYQWSIDWSLDKKESLKTATHHVENYRLVWHMADEIKFGLADLKNQQNIFAL